MNYVHTGKIIKTGTSLCVVLPKKILNALKMERGDQVVFFVTQIDTIVIRKMSEVELMNYQKDIQI